MVTCGVYWKTDDMYKWIHPSDEVEKRVREVTSLFPAHIVGIHIRRTDNWNTMKYSPTNLFAEAMDKEIEKDRNVKFFLASDSMEEKIHFVNLYGDRIITSMKDVNRNTEEGIINAFAEMNILSQTEKIYAGDSSYARISSEISGIKLYPVDLRYL